MTAAPRPTRAAVVRRELAGELGMHVAGFALAAAATYCAVMSLWAEGWVAVLSLVPGGSPR